MIRKVVRIAARILATGFSPSLFIGSRVSSRKFGRKKGGGQTLWYAIVFCEMSKISWQTGKHRPKDDLENHSEGQSFFLEQWLNIIRPHCQDNTSNDPFSRCTSVQQFGYRSEWTITEYSLTTSTKVNYKIQKERNIYLVFRLRGETEHDTNDNVTTNTFNTFKTAHMNTDT